MEYFLRETFANSIFIGLLGGVTDTVNEVGKTATDTAGGVTVRFPS